MEVSDKSWGHRKLGDSALLRLFNGASAQDLTPIGGYQLKLVRGVYVKSRGLTPWGVQKNPCWHLFRFESRSSSVPYLHGLLLPISSTASYPAVAGLWLVGDIRLRRCEFTHRLLQHCSCWCTKARWPHSRRKKFPEFSRAIIILFQRLSQQKFWRFGSIYGDF